MERPEVLGATFKVTDFVHLGPFCNFGVDEAGSFLNPPNFDGHDFVLEFEALEPPNDEVLRGKEGIDPGIELVDDLDVRGVSEGDGNGEQSGDIEDIEALHKE